MELLEKAHFAAFLPLVGPTAELVDTPFSGARPDLAGPACGACTVQKRFPAVFLGLLQKSG